MLDHGGVLDGEITDPGSIDYKNDLVLEKFEWGGVQVLKNGVRILSNINQLVDKYDYQVVFHSKNCQDDQIRVLRQLQAACQLKGVKFPQVFAMAVYDPSLYPDKSSSNPVIIRNEYGTLIVGWGSDDFNGKASVRRALEKLLDIDEEQRPNHIVFDDGEPNVTIPRLESYQAFLIGNELGRVSLDQALQLTLINARRPQLEAFRQDLIKKIDNYLYWRDNKDSNDGRGYRLGLFTKLRHYSEFGKIRANNLKQKLEKAAPEDLISIFQKHLSKDSKLNNHSLDTYLLEAVAQHKQLFNMSRDFNLREEHERTELANRLTEF